MRSRPAVCWCADDRFNARARRRQVNPPLGGWKGMACVQRTAAITKPRDNALAATSPRWTAMGRAHRSEPELGDRCEPAPRSGLAAKGEGP